MRNIAWHLGYHRGLEFIHSLSKPGMMDLKIKLLPGGKMPHKATDGAACYDLYARKIEKRSPFCYVVHLGVKMDIPEGYKAVLCGRSGLGETGWFFTLGIGVGDHDYTGEYRAIFWYNSCAGITEEKELHADLGWIKIKQPLRPFPFVEDQRCCQFSLEEMVKYSIVEVEEINRETARGEGGFGHTGK